MLERRVALLGVLRAALGERDVLVRIGARERAAGAALARARRRRLRPARAQARHRLGDRARCAWTTPRAIRTVREAARQLSRFVEDVYEG